jgi:hypothetical protein
LKAFSDLWQNDVETYKVGSSDVQEMLTAYLQKSNAEAVDGATFAEDLTVLHPGTTEIGTLRPVTAVQLLVATINHYNRTLAPSADRIDVVKMRVVLANLLIHGAVFGYDGNAVHACAGAPVYLLILDRVDQKVYGVDLTPCDETTNTPN